MAIHQNSILGSLNKKQEYFLNGLDTHTSKLNRWKFIVFEIDIFKLDEHVERRVKLLQIRLRSCISN